MNETLPSRSLNPLKSGGKAAPIVPQTFEDVQRIASMAVAAGLGSYHWKDRPEQMVAKATAAIMHGMELGLSPMQSLGGIAVINGKTTIYGDMLTAVLWASGFKVKKWIEGAGDDRIARARITRPDGEVIEASFSVAQAKQARLWDTRDTVKKKSKDGGEYVSSNDSAWHLYPDDMLGWKAVGRCVRDGASDATRGMAIREDMDHPVVDITPEQTGARPNATASGEPVGIPDIPDIPEVPVVGDTVATAPTDDIADESGLVAKIRADFADCRDAAERIELWENSQDLIERLSAENIGALQKMFEDAA